MFILNKLKTSLKGEEVFYELEREEKQKIVFNHQLGKKIKIEFQNKIFCINCGRKTNKSFSQGYCFPCFKKLPQTDVCLLRPELCHYHLNTCRDKSWGEKHCFIKHTIYLANTSGLKVGVTRQYQEKNRWMDQGAIQALPLGYAKDRWTAGKIEVLLKNDFNDKTAWQRMLFHESALLDLMAEKESVLTKIQRHFPEQDFSMEEEAISYRLQYPLQKIPSKKQSFDLGKTPVLEGEVWGIKGQYLLLSNGVFNVRKHTGYQVALELA